ncbi:LPS export ABC transporter periplasmic protein LptC [bacterium]|nr:LPS export ABC transporter periplasmic protein LptC [bacterium]
MQEVDVSRWTRFRTVLARDIKLILTIIILLVSIGAVNLIFYKSDAEINAIVNRPRDTRYSIALKGNKATGISDKGQIVWQIESDLVTVSTKEDQYEFHDATAHFFDAKGPNLRIEVGRIVYYEASKNLDLLDGIRILTRDEMTIKTDRVHWAHNVQQFVFPDRVTLVTKENNWVSADYLQGDRELRQLTFVGNCQVKVQKLTDTKFIDERKLTDAELKLEDFKNVFVHADMVIYDKDAEVLVALSDFSDKEYEVKPPYVVNPMTGERVKPPPKDEPTQLYFRKGEIELWADHIEVHMKDSWAKCYGSITMKVNPSPEKPGDDPALKSMRKRTTYIKANDIEYFWDSDYARTYGRSIVVQDDRRAGAWGVTYFGKYEDPETGQRRKVIFLDDEIFIYQGSGKWLKDDEIVKEFKNPDIEKMLYEEIKLTAGKAVMFLDSNDIYAETQVRIRQRDKAAECGETFYDDQKKKFLCQRGVEYWNKKDEHFTGDQIIFFTDRDDIEVNGKADAMIKIPEKYISELDKVDRRIKERGAKGTTFEETEKSRQEELARLREENPQWEFLPAWQDIVVTSLPSEGLEAIPEPPAPSYDASDFEWVRELQGYDISKSPWDKDGAKSVGELIDQVTGQAEPGAKDGREGESKGSGLVPPDGVPIPPPQISGLSGRASVKAALGKDDNAPAQGRHGAPPDVEFLPPPEGGGEGVIPPGRRIEGENFEIIVGQENEPSVNDRIDPPPPDGEHEPGSEEGEDRTDTSSPGDPGDAIIVQPPREGDS